MSSNEINENELKTLLSKSKDIILEYIQNHPELLYKGVPLVFIVYMFYPIIFTFWAWLPWIWASWKTYKMLPSGTFCLFKGIYNDKKWFSEMLKSIGQNQT